MNEFEVIHEFFDRQYSGKKGDKRRSRKKLSMDVSCGIGDDAALLRMPEGMELALTTDTLVMGVHFAENAPSEFIGYKSLAVNLSDLAAMGAIPAWATLSLTLPSIDRLWLKHFSDSFFSLADLHHVALVGGDTTRGPLNITISVLGWVPAAGSLRRHGARPGDLIYVSGDLGDAALALRILSSDQPTAGLRPESLPWTRLMNRLHKPTPRIGLGLALQGVASAAIDISDGLLSDLNHLCEASSVGASINIDDLPRSDVFTNLTQQSRDYYDMALGGGDDYELCFTLPPSSRNRLQDMLYDVDCSVACIGCIEEKPGIRCHYDDGRPYRITVTGYDHFAQSRADHD